MIERETLEQIAREAGQEVARLFGTVRAEEKEDGSLVTQADRVAQRLILGRLRQLQPDPRRLFLLAEESVGGDLNPGVSGPEQAELLAAVDPLDGTQIFAAGLPLWAVSIGLLAGGQPVAGVVHQPLVGGGGGRMFGVGATGPALLDGRVLQVPPFRGWTRHSQLAIPSSFFRFARLGRFPGRIRSLGSTAHHLALVAGGMVDAALVSHNWLWDLAGGAALIERAGGVLRSWSGRPVAWTELMQGEMLHEPVLAGSAGAVESLLELLAR